MKEVFAGLDFGATTTDAVLVKGRKLVGSRFWMASRASSADPKRFIEGHPEKATAAGLTGKKQAEAFMKGFGVPLDYFDEVQAIGLGGASACGLKKAVVASAGTGTCVVFFDGRKAIHLGGTGLGGGTIQGLSRLLVGETDLAELQWLAAKGSAKRLDLSVFEAIGKRVGLCPGEATASNFGKLVNPKKEDLAAGVLRMVGETIGVVASLAAKSVNSKNLVFIGRAVELNGVRETVQETVKMFGLRFFCPENPGARTAFGAALLARETKSK